MKRSFADILSSLDEGRAQKVARKLPAWADAGIEVPSALALEQCSSSATAEYKAELAALPVPAKILDLTGGLGVDSWAFSQVAERVVYFEQNAELAAAAARNFAKLGADNIEVRNETVTPETELPEADLIYADPARRNAAGRKVFLLEDCTPDILTLLPLLLRKAPVVLLKLSPMADLAMLADRLGPALREIHIVESDGEVKELLCLLLRDASPTEPEIVVVSLSGQAAASRSGELPPETSGCAGPLPLPSEAGPSLLRSRGWLRFPEAVAADVQQEGIFRFRVSEERAAEAVFAAGVQAGDTLLEPSPALLKAGAFKLPCSRWGLRKLAPSTHLYLGEATPGFKAWRVLEVLPFGAAAFRQLKRNYPRAEVTARNLPLGSEALRKKLGIAPGGDAHIFACRLADGAAVLLACTRELARQHRRAEINL